MLVNILDSEDILSSQKLARYHDGNVSWIGKTLQVYTLAQKMLFLVLQSSTKKMRLVEQLVEDIHVYVTWWNTTAINNVNTKICFIWLFYLATEHFCKYWVPYRRDMIYL